MRLLSAVRRARAMHVHLRRRAVCHVVCHHGASEREPVRRCDLARDGDQHLARKLRVRASLGRLGRPPKRARLCQGLRRTGRQEHAPAYVLGCLAREVVRACAVVQPSAQVIRARGNRAACASRAARAAHDSDFKPRQHRDSPHERHPRFWPEAKIGDV